MISGRITRPDAPDVEYTAVGDGHGHYFWAARPVDSYDCVGRGNLTATDAQDVHDQITRVILREHDAGGYTLADLERLREESRAGWDKLIRDREMRLMDQIGPDVYFHVLGEPDAL